MRERQYSMQTGGRKACVEIKEREHYREKIEKIMRKAVELYIELKVLIKKEKYFKSVNSQSEIEKKSSGIW